MIRSDRHIPLYLSAPHPCSYLPGRQSSTLFTDPDQPMEMATYGQLLRFGFRRSGGMVYAPRCEHCSQCVSVRIPVTDFSPRRNHRRISQRNARVRMQERTAEFDPQHYALYCKYTAARHEDGDMANATPSDYMAFLKTAWCETRFLEFSLDGRLIAVAVTDRLDDALSAVYTFFDPDMPGNSLGTFAILSQIALARRLGLGHLYLGYWIRDSRKMAYKNRFRPLEFWRDGRWLRCGPGDDLPN